MQVSRNSNLNIPRKIEVNSNDINSIKDIVETKKIVAKAEGKTLNENKINNLENDAYLKAVAKIPSNSNDLIVITIVKKLGAYVITITEKSPKKFRGVFVNRMQNYCLDTLEYLLKANFIKMDSLQNKNQRENYQKEAIINLKLLGYTSMLAENANCILMRQYKQISIQISEAISLITAWKKSDDDRFKRKN